MKIIGFAKAISSHINTLQQFTNYKISISLHITFFLMAQQSTVSILLYSDLALDVTRKLVNGFAAKELWFWESKLSRKAVWVGYNFDPLTVPRKGSSSFWMGHFPILFHLSSWYHERLFPKWTSIDQQLTFKYTWQSLTNYTLGSVFGYFLMHIWSFLVELKNRPYIWALCEILWSSEKMNSYIFTC